METDVGVMWGLRSSIWSRGKSRSVGGRIGEEGRECDGGEKERELKRI